MAENIVGALGELGFRELGVKERPGLVVLRRTKMPALLVETGFINSDSDNDLYDENLKETARSIAGAILGTLTEGNHRSAGLLPRADRSFPKQGKRGPYAVSADGSGIPGVSSPSE